MSAPSVARPRVDLDATTTLWLRAYTETRAKIAELEEIATQARRQVEAALGDAEEGVVDGHIVVRWTRVSSSRIDVKKLAAEHPAIAEAFRVPSESRRFTLPDGAE